MMGRKIIALFVVLNLVVFTGLGFYVTTTNGFVPKPLWLLQCVDGNGGLFYQAILSKAKYLSGRYSVVEDETGVERFISGNCILTVGGTGTQVAANQTAAQQTTQTQTEGGEHLEETSNEPITESSDTESKVLDTN